MTKQLSGGITAPKGFLAAGIHAGIKQTGQLDLALITSEIPGAIAGVFTTNKVLAAPVILDRQHLRKKVGQAIIINSGNANAFTGTTGLKHAQETIHILANQLSIPKHYVFVGSTGVIGVPLPISALRTGIPILIAQLQKSGHHNAAQAILTTDTRPKTITLRQTIGGKQVTIGGIAKGSGMIHPDMATMLAYLTTDAAIDQPLLQRMLRNVANQTFNCISVDGETSTNDTVLCLANGKAGNVKIRSMGSAYVQFEKLLYQACHYLAMEICRDGEGATKLIEIQITGATSQKAATQFAHILATSPLVKTAIFGEDPNWGRIIAALGRAGYPLRPDDIIIKFNHITVVKGGRGLGAEKERQVQKVMQKPAFKISISLGMGKGTATKWTTDLTYDYVKINASYRS